jgi:hypothetical protein
MDQLLFWWLEDSLDIVGPADQTPRHQCHGSASCGFTIIKLAERAGQAESMLKPISRGFGIQNMSSYPVHLHDPQGRSGFHKGLETGRHAVIVNVRSLS